MLDNLITLAPVLYLNSMKNSFNLYHILQKMDTVKLLKLFKIHSINLIDVTSNPYAKEIVDFICKHYTWFCDAFFEVISDRDPELIDVSQVGTYLKNYPAGSSVKCFEHFLQLIDEKKPVFRKFDYGKKKNLERYGQDSPPIYDISKVEFF